MRIRSVMARSCVLVLAFVFTAGPLQAAPITAAVPIRNLPTPITLGSGAQLNVPLYAQQTNVWCWDASSLMVIKYFRPRSRLQECTLATQATQGATCCTLPIPTPCVHTGWEMLTTNGFTATQTATLPFSAIVSQISTKHKPILYAIAWPGGGGHMLVATGYFSIAGQNFVRVNDPWPPPNATSSGAATESPTYEAWLGGPGYDHNPWAQWSDIIDTQTQIVIPFHPIVLQQVAVPPGPPDPMQLVTVQPEVTQRAARSLDQIRTAPPELIRALGFQSAAEAKTAQLGTPLREYSVPLNGLRTYSASAAPEGLLTGGTTLFYPVVANGVIRSSVRISAMPGAAPKLVSIGDTGTASRLQQIESLGPQLRKAGGASIPAVRVPALGLYFVARKGTAGLEIASTFDVPMMNLQRGVYESASAVFARLVPFARQINDKSVM
jgi:hypothetical protein